MDRTGLDWTGPPQASSPTMNPCVLSQITVWVSGGLLVPWVQGAQKLLRTSLLWFHSATCEDVLVAVEDTLTSSRSPPLHFLHFAQNLDL